MRDRREVWGDEPAVRFEGDGLFARDCLSRAYHELEADHHRQVIDLYVFGPHSASETATTAAARRASAPYKDRCAVEDAHSGVEPIRR